MGKTENCVGESGRKGEQGQNVDDFSEEMSDEEFAEVCTEHQNKFALLKNEYSSLFEYPGIKMASQDKIFPYMKDINMDEIAVIITNQELPGLFTSGLGVCIAVMARGFSEKNGTCLGLSHFTIMKPQEVLSKIQKKLTNLGCKLESIEFYLVGGQMPYRDGPEVAGLYTLDTESEFLSLSKEFNIVGAQFN
ncbi:MAG: hypothetical protein H0U49_04115, partial [Parachlamydiaceae bacterium]|nr:hypothetical protein [Parachlamydiaceae bacterium]